MCAPLALHLAALECPASAVNEITTLLLLAGIDIKLVDRDNRTAYAIARENGNQEFVKVFKHYMDVRSGKEDAAPYRTMMTKLQMDYNLHPPKPLASDREVGALLQQSIADYFAANSEIREAIQQEKHLGKTLNSRGTRLEQEIAAADRLRSTFCSKHRTGETPEELAIQEHLILPISEYGYTFQEDPITAIHTLRFADEQASKNTDRRRKLMIAGGKNFDELETDFIF